MGAPVPAEREQILAASKLLDKQLRFQHRPLWINAAPSSLSMLPVSSIAAVIAPVIPHLLNPGRHVQSFRHSSVTPHIRRAIQSHTVLCCPRRDFFCLQDKTLSALSLSPSNPSFKVPVRPPHPPSKSSSPQDRKERLPDSSRYTCPCRIRCFSAPAHRSGADTSSQNIIPQRSKKGKWLVTMTRSA